MESTKIRRASLGLFLAILAGFTGNANAQSTFGSVRGSTVDQSGAGLPETKITLHNLDENTNAETISDANGNFAFENLKPGHYSVTAAKEGFATEIVNQLELAARQTLRVDVKLNVAAQAQSIEVFASAASVNTENATLADSKNNADIMALPLNSRAVSTSPLAALATSPSVVKDSQGNINVGGALAARWASPSTEYLLPACAQTAPYWTLIRLQKGFRR